MFFYFHEISVDDDSGPLRYHSSKFTMKTSELLVRSEVRYVLLVSYLNLSGQSSEPGQADVTVRAEVVVVVMISPGPLPACPVWSLPHRKYASTPQKIYHPDLTHPALTLQQLPSLPPSLPVNIVLTARNSGKYFKLYVKNISKLFHDYKILFLLLVWYLPWNYFSFSGSWVNNKIVSIWKEIPRC